MVKQYGIYHIIPQTPSEDIGCNVEIDYSIPASTRGINMLLAKYHGQAYQTEVVMRSYREIEVPTLNMPLAEAKVALITDGGLVPRGNPDGMSSSNSTKIYSYTLTGKARLSPEDYEVRHQGYNNIYVLDDPNRLLPVDALRMFESEGKIGKLSEIFYTTAGVMTSVEMGTKFGEEIVVYLKETNVNAVILTSTCGLSTRCGAVITKEIERAGIPIVQITNLTKISEGVGSNRILRGNNVNYVLGNPALPRDKEIAYRKDLVGKALQMLECVPPKNESLVWI